MDAKKLLFLVLRIAALTLILFICFAVAGSSMGLPGGTQSPNESDSSATVAVLALLAACFLDAAIYHLYYSTFTLGGLEIDGRHRFRILRRDDIHVADRNCLFYYVAFARSVAAPISDGCIDHDSVFRSCCFNLRKMASHCSGYCLGDSKRHAAEIFGRRLDLARGGGSCHISCFVIHFWLLHRLAESRRSGVLRRRGQRRFFCESSDAVG